MRWRQVVALWGVFAVLLAWWLASGAGSPPPETAAPPAERVRFLEGVAAADVAGVRLERGARAVAVRRDGAYWRVTAPSDADVPSDLVAAFVQALLGSREIARAAATTVELPGFGLADGATRVVVEVSGRAPLELDLGGFNPTGTAVYARRTDGAGVVLIGRDVHDYADLLFGGLPAPAVPADAPRGDVG
jgi:hypothetical protein